MRKNNKDYSITEEKYEIIKKHIEKIDKIKNDLQKHINFEIPEYIIHDIAENEEFNHICLIINVAIVNIKNINLLNNCSYNRNSRIIYLENAINKEKLVFYANFFYFMLLYLYTREVGCQ